MVLQYWFYMKNEKVLKIINIINSFFFSLSRKVICFLFKNTFMLCTHLLGSLFIYHTEDHSCLSLFFSTIYLTTCYISVFLLVLVYLFANEENMSVRRKFLVIIFLCLLAYEINQHLMEVITLIIFKWFFMC